VTAPAAPGGPALFHLPVLDAAPVLVPLEDVVPLTSLLAPVAVVRRYLSRVGVSWGAAWVAAAACRSKN